ncbi:uncharacterized protein LOC134840804 [Symsagittifera roscoffensis]|uniref:uncharacterized protein LOC134840804 n=1 Tax=Symsagittifera roscoffensis TaxID=84072 RepID=UPI00307B8C60
MSELITQIKLVHGSALDRSSTGVFYVTAGQRVSLPTRKVNQKPFEMSNCCLLIEPSTSSSKKSNDISVLLEWYWSSNNTHIHTRNYTDVATLYIPNQKDETTAPHTQRLFNGRTFAASVEGGDSFHYWANSECWKGRVLKADDEVEPDAQPSVQPSAATFAQPSDEPRATSVEPNLAQLPVEPRATSSRTSIVEPNLQPARTRNLGVQTDGLTEMEDLRSQLQDLEDLRRAGEQELEDLRRELAAERKTSDQLRLQLSLQGRKRQIDEVETAAAASHHQLPSSSTSTLSATQQSEQQQNKQQARKLATDLKKISKPSHITLDFVNDLADCVDGFSVGAICLVAQEVGTLSYWYSFFADARAYERANRKKPSWRLQLQFSAESFRLVFCELDERVTNDNSTWRHVVDAELTELRNSFGKIKEYTESMHADALLRELYVKFVHWFIKNLL